MKFFERGNWFGEALILVFLSVGGVLLGIGGIYYNKMIIAGFLMILMGALIAVKAIDDIFLACSVVIIDERGIRKMCGKRRSQFIAWEDVENIMLSGRTSHHDSMVVASDIYVLAKNSDHSMPWWYLVFHGIFISHKMIFFRYSEDRLQEIYRYYEKEIGGPQPYNWSDYVK